MEPTETDQSNKKTIPKPIIILLIASGLIVYTLLSIWFLYYKGNVSKISMPSLSNNTSSPGIPQLPNTSNNSQVGFIPTANHTLGPAATPTPIPIPTPTPTPLQGPGRYACDPYSLCRDYSDENRQKYCTVTFADRNCLGQCGDPTKRCSQ